MNIQRLFGITLATVAITACEEPAQKEHTQTQSISIPQSQMHIASTSSAQTGTACQMPATPPDVSAGQGAFDQYSWDMFVALNWPASLTERGEPDCSKPLNATGPRVWQTYKTSNEVFLPDAANPGDWNAGYGVSAGLPTVSQLAKASNSVAIDSHQEAVGGWLIDQYQNPTYFQMGVNENWYNYVVNNNLYNKDNFSNNTKINLPWNAAELKYAWRILNNDAEKTRYIHQQAVVAEFDDMGNKTGTKTVTLGLVGFHIVYKPEGYPQSIWSTFEHVDNVPDSEYDAAQGKVVNKPVAGVHYNYFNATATKVNQSPCAANDPTKCQSFRTPNPLTRVTPIRDDAKTANTTYHAKSDIQSSVLANYQLITTQWPTQPNNPGALWGSPTPTISANTTMESYIQTSSNCMNCHGMATLPGLQAKSDFSFLFGEAQSATTAQ